MVQSLPHSSVRVCMEQREPFFSGAQPLHIHLAWGVLVWNSYPESVAEECIHPAIRP